MNTMRLRILLPEQILLDVEARKITAEAVNGAFGLLPRHVDFVTALAPGILTFVGVNGREEFVAVDEGIMLKRGKQVQVSTRNAVIGQELGELKRLIAERFRNLSEYERKSRDALYKLEADLIRRFMEL
jgi:F-type H+-transporting ATPase subunit epsilon